MEDNKVKLTVDIPADLKLSFKVFCTKNRISMTEVVEELIRGYMADHDEAKQNEIG
jgi:hypothetical protein